MLPSKCDKQIGFEHQSDHHYDAEQEEIKIKLEYVPGEEQEHDIFANIDETVVTNIKVSCSDSEDPFGASADGGSLSQTNQTNERPVTATTVNPVELQNGCSMKESTPITVMRMFRSISEQIASIHNKIDKVVKEVANSSDRIRRLERKISISLVTTEQLKDVIAMPDKTSGNNIDHDTRNKKTHFEFKRISNEEEFTAFDTKLGTDAEYYSLVQKEFRKKISYAEPDNRMHVFMDMVFDRSFMPLCSWTGRSLTGPKVVFRQRTNILKLFVDIGSTRFIAVNDLYVQNFIKYKLRHAKERVNLKGIKSLCRKHKRKMATVTPDETETKYRRTS